MVNKEQITNEEDGTIWPPPPSIHHRSLVPQEPFIVRLSLGMLILVDIGIGLAGGGVHCLVRLLSHRPIDWRDTAIQAVVFALMFFTLHLWLRSYFKKRMEIATQETDQAQSRHSP